MLEMKKQTRSGRSTARLVSMAGVAIAVLFAYSLSTAQQKPPSKSKLTPNEQLKKGSKQMEEMKATLARGFEQLRDARQEQNIQKLNCVNEALSAIKGLMRLSEQNYVMLQEAAAKKDARTAEHEFVKLSIAHNKIKELDGRVQSCGGPANSGRIDGRPDIDRIKDADLPTEDPVESLNDFRADLDRPPSASPFF